MDRRKLFESLLANGGLTLDRELSPIEFNSGFQVSLPGLETQLPLEVSSFRNFCFLLTEYQSASFPGASIGLWIDSGVIYFDLSEWIPDRESAIHLGENRRQIAVWDWENKSAIQIRRVV
jgi:hypothetical protein